MTDIIKLLKQNKEPLCLLSSEMQDVLLGCKADDLEYLSCNSSLKNPDWRVNANTPGEIKQSPIDTYRLRPDYADIKWPDKVFASTTDSEKDSMNNVIGVTAHCKCGNVFCDDVVHGKSQRKADEAEKPEKVEVRIIRGDGWISPVSTSSISAHVKVFGGKKWVSLVALEEANKSIAHAEYWFKHLNVWGNSDTVQKIYKLIGLTKTGDEPEPEEKPEIEEYVIEYNRNSNYQYYIRENEHTISAAVDDPDFIGFKYESGQVELSPIVFKSDCSTKSICQFRDLVQLEVLHATHVLFRRQK